jgi:signal transduction histidine kinase
MRPGPRVDSCLRSREFELTVDVRGTVTWADERAGRLLGDVVGRPFLTLIPDDTAPKARPLLDPRGDEVTDWELWLLTPEGPTTFAFQAWTCGLERHLLGTRLPYGREGILGRLDRTVVELAELNRELSREKRAALDRQRSLERTLEALQEAHAAVRMLHQQLEARATTLREALESKRRALSHLSHELRTPLQAVRGFSELVLTERARLAPDQAEALEFIHDASLRMIALLNDALALAKAEAGKEPLRLRPVGASEILAGLRGLARSLLKDDASVAFHLETEGDPRLFTDAGKLTQILQNLVVNAVKFTATGEIRVVCAREGPQVRFEVRDTGTGLAPEALRRIFEEFAQVHTPAARPLEGTGLGLPLARRYAEQLGGQLTAHSQEGRGSTFRLVIPAVHPSAPPEVTGGASPAPRPPIG